MNHFAAVTVILAGVSPIVAADPAPDFVRDVKPILTAHCLSCHGAQKQKGGLRFDRKIEAMRGGDNGKAIVVGKAGDSPLIHRITATDETQMPPKGERLTVAQIATLRKWIDNGAAWPDDALDATASDWWSFQPLRKPAAGDSKRLVDDLIRAKLKDKGLSPAALADRRTLIRRAYFDLLGLPPTPSQIDAFVNSTAPDAWPKLINELLASSQYGERWARHWLDVVHYGETHGYDKDQPRPNAWPYRDYVIRAFNSDKPYNRFLQEQIAGDVLFPGTPDSTVALGFLAAGPWDLIGHVEVPETKIDGKIARHLDRDDFVANTMSTFTGLTVHCAQCHNHKFDPITHEDYYRLQAVFAGIDRADVSYDTTPEAARQRLILTTKKAELVKKSADLLTPADLKTRMELNALDKRIAESKLATKPKPAEHGYHSALEKNPEITKWVQIDLGDAKTLSAVILRTCDDDFNSIGAGFGFPVRFKIELSDDPTFRTATMLVDRTAADVTNPASEAFRAEVSGRGRYLRITATRLVHRMQDYMFALAEVEALDAAGENVATKKIVTALDSIESPGRWAKSYLTDGKYPVEPKLSIQTQAQLQKQRDSLISSFLNAAAVDKLKSLKKEIDVVEAELIRLAQARQRVYAGAIYNGEGSFVGTGASGGKPRPITILPRGDVTKPGKLVTPGAVEAVPGPAEFRVKDPENEGERRAALARWLADRNNPLTWRVMANRVWQYHFGRGLVDTPNDFGKMGQAPSHPDLLDALAIELREHQSIKTLHRQIMLSETYQQSSATNAVNARIDSDNRWVWRQNVRKLEAEAVRDSILSVAGKLDLTMGGPSFRDFVVEKPEHSPHYEYHLHDPEDVKSHRRTIYRFVVRSKQQPFLAALDCADPSLAVDKRNQSLSPQQALALLNNRLCVAMAKHFATRVEKLGTTDTERVAAAFELALGRKPMPQELTPLVAYAKEFGLANACRTILNLNEFVFID